MGQTSFEREYLNHTMFDRICKCLQGII